MSKESLLAEAKLHYPFPAPSSSVGVESKCSANLNASRTYPISQVTGKILYGASIPSQADGGAYTSDWISLASSFGAGVQCSFVFQLKCPAVDDSSWPTTPVPFLDIVSKQASDANAYSSPSLLTLSAYKSGTARMLRISIPHNNGGANADYVAKPIAHLDHDANMLGLYTGYQYFALRTVNTGEGATRLVDLFWQHPTNLSYLSGPVSLYTPTTTYGGTSALVFGASQVKVYLGHCPESHQYKQNNYDGLGNAARLPVSVDSLYYFSRGISNTDVSDLFNSGNGYEEPHTNRLFFTGFNSTVVNEPQYIGSLSGLFITKGSIASTVAFGATQMNPIMPESIVASPQFGSPRIGGAVATQDHIHLSDTFAGGAENGPTYEYKVVRRLPMTEIGVRIKRGIRGKVLVMVAGDDEPKRHRIHNYMLYVTRSELEQLKIDLGKKLWLMDNIHENDGAAHASIKLVAFYEMDPPQNVDPRLENFYVAVKLKEIESH